MITALHTPDPNSATGLPIAFQFEAAANWAAADSYIISLRIQKEIPYRTYNYSDLITLDQEPDANGKVTFNLKHLLKTLVDSDPPDWDNKDQPAICEKMNALYRVYVDEMVDGVQDSQLVYGSPFPLFAIHGSFPWKTGQNYSAYTSAGLFLTNQPRVKKVTDCQPEFLRYIVPAIGQTVSVKAEVTFDDDTTQAVDPGISIVTEFYDIISIPAGYLQLGLDTVVGNIVSWKVWLENQLDNVMSEEMTYQLELRAHSSITRYYLFENRLGGYDTLRTTGVMEVKDQRKSESYSIIPPAISYEGTRTKFQSNITSEKLYKQQSGWMNQSDLEWAKEILASEDIYLIGNYLPNLTAAGNLIPINITSSQTDLHKDHQFLKSLAFTAEDAFKEIGL